MPNAAVVTNFSLVQLHRPCDPTLQASGANHPTNPQDQLDQISKALWLPTSSESCEAPDSLCVADPDTLRVSSHIFHLLSLFQGLPLVSHPVRQQAATWGEIAAPPLVPQLPSPLPLDAASKHCSLGCNSVLKHTFRRQHGVEEDLELFGSAWLVLPASVSSICLDLRPLAVAQEKAKVSPHPHSIALRYRVGPGSVRPDMWKAETCQPLVVFDGLC